MEKAAKQIYIPESQTARFDNLKAERIVVNGELTVTGNLSAKQIFGKGQVICGGLDADTVKIDRIAAESAVCNVIAVKRGYFERCYAAERIIATEFLSAQRLQTPKLSAACSEIGECDCDSITHLKPRKRSMLRFLLAAYFIEWRVKADGAYDEEQTDENAEAAQTERPDDGQACKASDVQNAEVMTLIQKLACMNGYTLTKSEKKAA